MKSAGLKRCRIPVICCGLVLVVVSGAIPFASERGGTLLWERQFDLGLDSTSADIVGSTSGTLFLLENGPFHDAPNTNAGIVLDALDERTGDPLWSETWNPTQGDDIASAVLESGRLLVLQSPGRNATSYGEPAFPQLRGYDARTGGALWTTQVCGPMRPFEFPIPGPMIAKNDRVFVSVSCNGASSIKSYDTASGDLIWEVDDHLGAVSLSGERLLTTGWFPDRSYVIRSLNARTGEVAWEASGRFVSADQGGPLLAFREDDDGVRLVALDGSNGADVWEFRLPRDYQPRDYQQGWSLVEDGGRIFVTMHQAEELRIESHDAATGELRWSTQVADPILNWRPSSIAASGGRLFFTGRSGTKAYDANNGKLLWSQAQSGYSISAGEGGVIVAGGDAGLFVYAAPSGDLQWSARGYDFGTGWPYEARSGTYGAVRSSGRLIATGSFQRPPYEYAGTVQVFDAK